MITGKGDKGTRRPTAARRPTVARRPTAARRPTVARLATIAALMAIAICGPVAASASAASYPIPNPPVVLVTGLHDSTGGMRPGGNCNSVGTMAALCSALVAAGQQVYVVSSAAGGGAVINNAGAIDANAQSLANFLSSTVKEPVFLVGHSMGGIISRIAISRFGAQAAGLFTIGSPQDGSFGADLAEGVTGIPCSGIVCSALEAAANKIIGQFGAVAVADLSKAARSADNANLSPVGVPLWEYAGTACGGPDPTGYYFPNDGIVGRSSAFGATANMGPATQTQGNDFHQSTLQTVLKLPCSPFHSTNIELGDPTVMGEVVAAAKCIDSGTCGGRAKDLSADVARKKHARHKKRRILVQPRFHLRLTLLSATPETTAPGSPVTVPVTKSTDIVSTSAFDANCNGQQIPALPALSDQLFGLPPAALNCSQATITPTTTTATTTTTTPVQLAVLSDAKNVAATIVGHGTPLKVTVSATAPISAVVIAGRRRAVRLKPTGLRSRRVTVRVARKAASNTTLSATVAGVRYTGQIPPLPGPHYVVK